MQNPATLACAQQYIQLPMKAIKEVLSLHGRLHVSQLILFLDRYETKFTSLCPLQETQVKMQSVSVAGWIAEIPDDGDCSKFFAHPTLTIYQ
jgi:hypothetical protein